MRRERLDAMLVDRLYGLREVELEGFALEGFAGKMSPTEFVVFFALTHGCGGVVRGHANRIPLRGAARTLARVTEIAHVAWRHNGELVRSPQALRKTQAVR